MGASRLTQQVGHIGAVGLHGRQQGRQRRHTRSQQRHTRLGGQPDEAGNGQQPLRLQRGAANIAVRGGLDITPVRITCTPLTLTKGQKWYRVPSRRFHVQLEVGEDLPIAPFLNETGDAPRGDALAARRVTDHLTRYFDLSGDPTRAST